VPNTESEEVKNPILLTLAALALAGCATRPESIRASYVPVEKFQGRNCGQLQGNLSSAQIELESLSRRQNDKANVDAVGVFVLGIPFSKLSGDHEGDIARLKGEVEAVQGALAKGNCMSGGGEPPAVASNSIQEVESQLSVLAQAHSRGLLTDAEYNQRRARLLDGLTMQARPASLTPEVAPKQLRIADLDPFSGVSQGETAIHLTAVTDQTIEVNGGQSRIERSSSRVLGVPLMGATVSGFDVRQLQPGSTREVTFKPATAQAAVADLQMRVLGKKVVSTAGGSVGVWEVSLRGIAPAHFVAGISRSGDQGAVIEGTVLLEAMTGIVVSGEIRSPAAIYTLRRKLIS
jgi:hypothetical protein